LRARLHSWCSRRASRAATGGPRHSHSAVDQTRSTAFNTVTNRGATMNQPQDPNTDGSDGRARADDFDVTAVLESVFDGAELSTELAREVMGRLMDGKLSQMQAAALLAALRTRGESVDEIVGLAQAMRERSRSEEHTPE